MRWRPTRAMRVIVEMLSSAQVMEYVFDEIGGQVEKVPARDPLASSSCQRLVRQDVSVDGVVVTARLLVEEQMSVEERFLAALAGKSTSYTVTAAPLPMGTGVNSRWGARSASAHEVVETARTTEVEAAPEPAEDAPTYEVTVHWGEDMRVHVRPSLRTMMAMQQDSHGAKVSHWSDALVNRIWETYTDQ
jgi:hypothetical protein